MSSNIDRLAAAREKAAQIRQAHKEAGIAIVRLNPIEKLKAHPKSMRASINAMCWRCQGEDADPSVQWRIGNCLCTDCALWGFRPHQHTQGAPTPFSLQQD